MLNNKTDEKWSWIVCCENTFVLLDFDTAKLPFIDSMEAAAESKCLVLESSKLVWTVFWRTPNWLEISTMTSFTHSAQDSGTAGD